MSFDNSENQLVQLQSSQTEHNQGLIEKHGGRNSVVSLAQDISLMISELGRYNLAGSRKNQALAEIFNSLNHLGYSPNLSKLAGKIFFSAPHIQSGLIVVCEEGTEDLAATLRRYQATKSFDGIIFIDASRPGEKLVTFSADDATVICLV